MSLLHILPQVATLGVVVISEVLAVVIAAAEAVGEEIRFSPSSEERIEIIGPPGMAPAKLLERSGYFSGRFLCRLVDQIEAFFKGGNAGGPLVRDRKRAAFVKNYIGGYKKNRPARNMMAQPVFTGGAINNESRVVATDPVINAALAKGQIITEMTQSSKILLNGGQQDFRDRILGR
jgi:hypothetical protein